jgi:hypothetical protein
MRDRRFGSMSLDRSPFAAAKRAALALAMGVVLAALAACATAHKADTGHDPDVLTHDEVAHATGINAYEVVAQLRPRFLRARGRTSIMLDNRDLPVLYVDGVLMGSIERLREFSPGQIGEVRFLTPAAAQTKWGSGHPGGVVHLITAR